MLTHCFSIRQNVHMNPTLDIETRREKKDKLSRAPRPMLQENSKNRLRHTALLEMHSMFQSS